MLAQKSFKNMPKVASYGRFDLKIGTGLKFPANSTPVQPHSSHSDPFRDQKRFRKCPENVWKHKLKVVCFDQKVNSETMFDLKNDFRHKITSGNNC